MLQQGFPLVFRLRNFNRAKIQPTSGDKKKSLQTPTPTPKPNLGIGATFGISGVYFKFRTLRIWIP